MSHTHTHTKTLISHFFQLLPRYRFPPSWKLSVLSTTICAHCSFPFQFLQLLDLLLFLPLTCFSLPPLLPLVILAGNVSQVAFKCECSVHSHSVLPETERAGWQEGRPRDGEEAGRHMTQILCYFTRQDGNQFSILCLILLTESYQI